MDEKSALDGIAANSETYDSMGVFPENSIDLLKQLGWLSQPDSKGGTGELLRRCRRSAKMCGSTGLILAMHHVMVACLLRHGADVAEMYPKVLTGEWLVASSTTEAETAGDTSRSSCSIAKRSVDQYTLEKKASVLSYGLKADLILVTARRSPEALPADQALIAISKRDYRLEKTHSWSGFGMRATVSDGYNLSASFSAAQIIKTPYREILNTTMLPYSHLLWSAVWLGIVESAIEKTRAILQSKSALDSFEVSAFSELTNKVDIWKTMMSRAEKNLPKQGQNVSIIASAQTATLFNRLKLFTSELAPQIVLECLRLGGFSSYSDAGPHGIGRELRDVLSAQFMISNTRIRKTMNNIALDSGVSSI